MEIKFFTREADFIKAGVDFINDVCSGTGKKLSFGLCGGATPMPLYKKLNRTGKIPIEKIDFWQTDERYVSKDNSDSNLRMINENLFAGTRIPHSFHFFDTGLNINDCLKKYQKDIEQNLSSGLDLIILGIGKDGHIASLFPESDALNEKNKAVAHTQTEKFRVRERLTMTFPVIMESKKIMILLSGKEKEQVLHEMLTGKKSPAQFPAKNLLSHKDLTIFFLY